MVKNEKKQRLYWVFMLLFSCGMFFRFYDGMVNKINTTMFAFTYEYGFVSRGLVGTVFRFFNWFLPGDWMNYVGVVRFTQIFTAIYYLLLFAFFYLCLQKSDEVKKNVQCLEFLFAFFAIPMFATEYNFGRLDLYMTIVSLIAVMLLVRERFEWLVIPLAVIGVMVHQGYVFMFANVILVLLLYKALNTEGKKKRKYYTLFIITFIAVSILFLWFELFSHMKGMDIYNSVVATAKSLSRSGEDIHWDVVDKEILGIDLTAREVSYHRHNYAEFPIFVVLMLPYIIIGFRCLLNIIKRAQDKKRKISYWIVLLGAGTILPDMILKVDYGRWMFSIIFYYFVIVLALIACGDAIVKEEVCCTMHRVKEKSVLSLLLLVYPIFFVPFNDICICQTTTNIMDYIKDIVLPMLIG